VPAIAGRVRRIGAFRDDPFDRQGAGFLIENWAEADLVVAVLQRRSRACQQLGEEALAFGQRPRCEILAVEMEKIEQEED
jgi:hypothetical protein